MTVWMHHDPFLPLMIILDTRRTAHKCRHLLTSGGHMPCYRSTTAFHQSKYVKPEGISIHRNFQHLHLSTAEAKIHKKVERESEEGVRIELTSVCATTHLKRKRFLQPQKASQQQRRIVSYPHHNNITYIRSP